MPKEIELKLSLPKNCIKQLLHVSLLNALSISQPVQLKLYTIYYDTPDLALKNKNCALRLRRIANHWVQTVKTEGSVASGLHERNEWEVTVTKKQLDLTQLNDPGLTRLLGDFMSGKQLQQIFITQFTRHTRVLQMSDGSQIEFCLDHGKISTNHTEETLIEIELELKSGKPVQLFQLALTLVQSLAFPLRLENRSKAERGYLLYTGDKIPPVTASPVVLKADMQLATAFILIVRNCLDQLTRNEYGMLTGSDMEYLHQMHLALCRLKAAFAVFSTGISTVTPLNDELMWLTYQLNSACEWDMLAYEQLPHIQAIFARHGGIATLMKACEILHKQHYKNACNSIRSKRYTTLILKLNLWLEEVKEKETKALNSRMADKPALMAWMESWLTNRHQQIIAAGKELDKLDAESLSSLYLSIKEQRHAVEFFQTFCTQEKAKKYLGLLATLENGLAAIHDSSCIQKLVTEIPTSKTKTLMVREAVGIILGWHSQRLQQKKAELKSSLLSLDGTLPL